MSWVLAVFKFARERGDEELAQDAEAVILDEVGLTQAFTYKGTSVIPAPRVKGEKKQGPVDDNRDRLRLVLCDAGIRKLKVGRNFWKDDEGNLDVILARELREDGVWDDELVTMAQHADLPKLCLSIAYRGWSGREGFEAWIDDTLENRKIMGRDACHFVHAGPDGIWWRYDWKPELDAEGKSNNHYLKRRQR